MAKSRLIAGLSAIALSVTVAPALAGTTGQLSGYVHDDMGDPLQGVSVRASSPAQIGAEQSATTEADGSFRFPRLAPGIYTVMVDHVGHAPQRLEGVQVRLDRVTGVQVALLRASFASEVVVTEMSPVVDPVQVSTGQTFTSEYMTETRTDWTNLITQTAGSSQEWRRVLGSTPQDGGYLLDGMDSTNWYQRHPNLAAMLPFDAIQEVAVHTAGFEAEFGHATGALVNVTTKSGGNRFSGSVDARYTGSSFETAGEHYDPDQQVSDDARFAATLGGPILTDRLWFFTAYGKSRTRETLTGAPTTSEDQWQNFLGKLTWQPAASWSVVGKYSYAPLVEDNFGSSPFRAADATSRWDRKPSIATLETVGVLSPSLLWGLRLGRKGWEETGLPADGDFAPIGHYNLMTGMNYGSWGSQSYARTHQNEVSTDVSWLVDLAGAHDLKAGLSIGDPRFTGSSCWNGSGRPCAAGVEGFFFQDLVDSDGDGGPMPYLMPVSKADGPLDYGGRFFVAFLQDAWRLGPDVTLKLGVRWDRVAYDNETGGIADLSKIQPRAGIAWDIGGRGRSVVRASWGRFMHPGTTIIASLTNEAIQPTEYWLSCSALVSVDPAQCAALADSLGLGYRTDPENWDPAGWILDPGNVFFSEPSQAVDDLRAGYADEWLVGFEREVGRRTSVELTYVNKASRDLFDDTCNGNIPDPTPDSECDFYVIANLPAIKFDYEALMLRFESHALDNLHLLASWVISESKGSMDFNTGATGAWDFYPYHFVNRYGYLTDHSRHRLKLNGYWQLPYDFSLAFDGWWQSEFRWTPYDPAVPGMPYGSQFTEPRGSGRGGSLHQLDLQLGKGFSVGPARLELLATVINATNSQSENEICGSVTGCGDFDLGEGTAWQQPRRYELGFRVEF